MNRWVRLASWVVPPVLMAGVYTVLATLSNTDNTGKAWMAIGFGFVVVAWLTFRILVAQTALARAVASGDPEKLLAATRTRRDAAGIIYRALAHELRGEWQAALAALADAKPAGNASLEVIAASVRSAALVETGEVAAARRVFDDELEPRLAKLDTRLHAQPHLLAGLARGRLLLAEGQRDAASRELQRVIDDMRTSAAMRERARALKIA